MNLLLHFVDGPLEGTQRSDGGAPDVYTIAGHRYERDPEWRRPLDWPPGALDDETEDVAYIYSPEET